MKSKRTLKFICLSLVLVLVVSMYPTKAQALDVDIDVPSLTIIKVELGKILADTSLMQPTLGFPGAATARDAALGGVVAGCKIASESAEKPTTFLGTITSGFGLINGSPVESARLSAQIAVLQAQHICLTAAKKTALSGVGMSDISVATNRAIEIDNAIEQTKNRLDTLLALQRSSIKDVMKTIVFKIVLNLQEEYTTKYVASLVDRYRIPSMLQYGKALSSQLYAMDSLRTQHPEDSELQLIVRSMIQADYFNSPAYKSTASTLITQRAQRAVVELCNPVSDSTADFYNAIASCGSVYTNPTFVETMMADSRDSALTAGQTAAQRELAGGNGFMNTRPCGSNLGTQKEIDAKTRELTSRIEAARVVYNNWMKDGRSNEQINEVTTELDNRQGELAAFLKDTKSPITKLCGATKNPSEFIANTTTNYLKTYLDSQTNIKTDMPVPFVDMVSRLAESLIKKVLPGGSGNDSTLGDIGLGLLDDGITELQRNIAKPNPTKLNATSVNDVIIINASPTTVAAGKEFLIRVNLSGADPEAAPYRVIIKSPSGSVDVDDRVEAAESTEFVFDAPTGVSSLTYVVEVYSARTGAKLKSETITVQIQQVAGISTIRSGSLQTNKIKIR